ncbi:MAG: GtrA family protein [Betaproteobacteria bacterium]|nr:GtrA family protein [Betaproteobacteria bacterium]MDE2057198.1 GtrA family protein [Betaproteobacteria bacterium]
MDKTLINKPHKLNKQHYFSFIVAGTCGFIVDAGVVTILSKFWGMGLVLAKVFSFLLAVTVTWIINRRYTFKYQYNKSLVNEWVHYFLANSVGAIINNSLYIIMIMSVTTTKIYPALAVAIGSLGGMFFNYIASRWWVFKQ